MQSSENDCSCPDRRHFSSGREARFSRSSFETAPGPCDSDSPILGTIMDAFAANSSRSKQALNSEKIREGLKEILLGPGQLHEAPQSAVGRLTSN